MCEFAGLQADSNQTPAQVLSCECCQSFKNIYFKGDLWTTASELYWYKVEVIIEKDISRDDNRGRIQDPVKNLRYSFSRKYLTIFNGWLFLQNTSLFVSKGYEYALIKLNKILVCCHLFHKKLELQSLKIYFQIQFYLHIITLS